MTARTLSLWCFVQSAKILRENGLEAIEPGALWPAHLDIHILVPTNHMV